jgi:hypothetical protein
MEDLVQSSVACPPSAIQPSSPVRPVPISLTITCGNYENFIDTLRYRFGFLCDSHEDEVEVEDGEVLEDEKKSINDAMCTFLVQSNGLAPIYHRRFLKFTEMLSTQDSNSQLWDLDDSTPRHLDRPPTSNDSSFSITTLQQDGRVFYHVKPPMQQEFSDKFCLLLPTASTAVECYRRRFSSISEATWHLIKAGKSFRTFMRPMGPMRPLKYGRPKLTLPPRGKAYPFAYHDFVSYERERERLFQYPHLRAALLEGGILWRLAMECLDPHVAVLGPSDSANDFGDRILLPDGGTLVDDSLTDNERNLICGVYAGKAGSFVYH